MNKRIKFAKLVLGLLFCGMSWAAQGQDPTDSLPGDPGSLGVYSLQDLQFGAFSHGAAGGSVIISPAGARSVTGSVTALDFGISYFQAIFNVTAPEGMIISISNGPDATLLGSNGGSMLLHLGESSPGSPFVNMIPSPGHVSVGIGGVLTVGNASANPPGAYSGTIYVTFNQE